MPSARGLVVVVALSLLAGCSADGADRASVEQAVGTSFGHRLAAAGPGSPPDPGTGASCRSATGSDRGAGDWSCALSWTGPDGLAHSAEYDLQVSTDGCFRAAQQALVPLPAGAAPAGFEGCTRPG